MDTIIKTEKSYINVYNTSGEYKDLMELCIAEIMDKLLENPKININGKSAIQHRSVGFFSNDSIITHFISFFPQSRNLFNIIYIK